MKTGICGHGKKGRLRHTVAQDVGNHEAVHLRDSLPLEGVFRVSTDSGQVIDGPQVEAVFDCTPNYVISDLVVQALDAGKHPFAEKSPGGSSSEVLDMVKAEGRNPGIKHMFGFNHRYHEPAQEAKRHLDRGESGKILWMRGRYGKGVGAAEKDLPIDCGNTQESLELVGLIENIYEDGKCLGRGA